MKERAKIQDQKFKIELTMRGMAADEALATLAGYLPASAQATGDGGEAAAVRDRLGRTWTVTECAVEETCALSTPVLSYEDMDDYLRLVVELRRKGACGGEGCGMRISASLAEHLPHALSNLHAIIAGKMDLLDKALLCTAGGTRMAEIHVGEDGMAEVLPSTVASDLDPDEMRACIQLGCAIAAQATNQSRVRTAARTYENERYAFRCWLTRMGMNGDEYKATRARLTKRLKGDSSFKGGRGKTHEPGAAQCVR